MYDGQVTVAVQPTEEPVSLDEAKLHLRVDGTEEDDYIAGRIVAGRIVCELAARRAFVSRTLELRLTCWPGARLHLPTPPLVSVESISYTDDAGNAGTVPSSDYVVYAGVEPGLIVLKPNKAWPSVSLMPGPSLVVRYVAGYGAADQVPVNYKQAVLLTVGHLYENREAVVVGTIATQLPQSIDALLGGDRVSWW
jgi:uncharacterized phiE125 gp8 family phage protein